MKRPPELKLWQKLVLIGALALLFTWLEILHHVERQPMKKD